MKLKELINKLSKSDVEELYNNYKSVNKIANLYGVSKQTICRLMDHYEIKRNNNIGSKTHFFNENYFENIDSEEKAYWLGFIMADGCVYEGTENTFRLQINLKYDDVSHLNKFQKAIGSDYSIQRKEIGNSVAAILKINSTKMCNDLIKHGVVPKKSLICEFPNINENLYRHFIRGVFDGDGSVTATLGEKFSKNVEIVGSVSLITSIANILNLKYYKSNGRDHVLTVKASSNESIIYLYNYFYENSTVYLQRKKKVYDILVYILRSPLME